MKSAGASPFAPATLRTYLAFCVVLLGALCVTSCGSSSTASPRPILSTSASALNFGAVMLGSTSSLSLSLTNSGTVSLTISQASISGSNFSISGITTPLTLSPNQAASAIVKFAPVQTGGVDGSISLTSNATNSPTLITLTGNGVVGTHGAALLWTASTSLVAGYNAYRATEFGGSYTKLNAALITDTTYTDSTVQAGDTYYYVVTAVDSAGIESVYSNQVTAQVP